MKQAALTSPGKFEVQDVPLPRPAAGEVLLRVLAVGVCGSDLHMFKEGRIGGITFDQAGKGFVPGHECMGRVEEVGDGVDRAWIGRRVFIEPAINCGRCAWCLAGKPNVCPHHDFLGLPPKAGCLSQYMTHPVRLVEPIPDEITDDVAVLLEPLAIAVHSMDRVGAKPGCAAVVLGAGPIGLTHTLLLARSGIAPLIVTDRLDYRLDMASRLGATHVFNPDRTDVVAAVRDLTHGAGAGFVFECAGQAQTFEQMVEVAAPAARIGVVGIPSDDRLAFTHSAARRKGLDLLMIRRANLTLHRALARVVHERLGLGQLATHHWPIEQVDIAFDTAAHYRDGVVKAIVNP